MRKFTIKKKNGKKRLIYAPSPQEKHIYRCLVPKLTRLAQKLCDPEVVHGFMPGRSPVTNALAHVGYRYTLSLDLQDFFDSCTRDMFPPVEFLCEEWEESERVNITELLCSIKGKPMQNLWLDGAARQGLPTSPVISNISAISMDAAIKKLLLPFSAVYTRYADDLTISCNNLDHLIEIRWRIRSVVEAHHFKINDQKTRIQWAGYGRRIITGVAVDDHGVYPTRSVRRRLRAALHQKRNDSARGLAEWIKLKPPNPDGPKRFSRVQRAMARHVASRLKPKLPNQQ